MDTKNHTPEKGTMRARTLFVITFLLIGVVPVIIMGFWITSNVEGTLKASGQEKISSLAGLEVIANLKVDTLESFFAERKGNIETAQDYFNIKTNLPIVTRLANDRTNPEYLTAKQMLDSQLKTFQEVYGYSNVMLVSPAGRIVYVTDEEHRAERLDMLLTDLENRAFEEGKKGVYFSDIYRGHENRKTHFEMLLTAPAHDFDEKFIGVIAFEIDMDPIYDLIQDTTGLGETGETLIGKKFEPHLGVRAGGHASGLTIDHVVFLNPLRRDPNAALERVVTIGSKEALPIQEATQGRDGAGSSVDYRGEEILAAWRYVPSLNWGLVAKIDHEEVFEPISGIRESIRNFIIIFALVIVFLALFFATGISRPVKRLTKDVDGITKGNFDVQLRKSRIYEINSLTDSLDRILSSLKLAVLRTGISKAEMGIKEAIKAKEEAEELKKEVEKEYKNLVDNALIGVYRTNVKGDILYANKALVEIFGFKSIEEFIAEGIISRYKNKKDREKLIEILKKKGSVNKYELEALSKTGETKYILISATLAKDILSGMILDITQRKRTEENLKKYVKLLELYGKEEKPRKKETVKKPERHKGVRKK